MSVPIIRDRGAVISRERSGGSICEAADMQTLDIDRPGMPDLQFTLLVTALCTSRLTALNIPEVFRTRIFDRCWVLIHDSPPPGRPEERVLDLRPWTEVTLEAMVETIRNVLTDAGIRTLMWDHTPSDSTRISTPDRLDHLFPQQSKAHHGATGEAADFELRHLIGELAVLMSALSPALKRRAANLATDGRDDEVVAKLVKGADVIRESGYVYLSWARHYATLSEGLEDTGEADDPTFNP